MAAVVVVVSAAAGAMVIASRRDGSPARVATDGADALCASLARPLDLAPGHGVDVVVFLAPHATTTLRQGLESALAADPRIETLRYVDQAEAFDRFRTLFAEEETMLESIGPTDVPTSFELDLVDPDTSGDVVAELRRRPDVYEARADVFGGVRVLDLLIWAGRDPSANAVTTVDWRGPGWQAQVDEVLAAADPQIAAAIDRLRSALDGRRPDDLTARAAATTLEHVAASRCDLAPKPMVAAPPPGSGPTTTTPGG